MRPRQGERLGEDAEMVSAVLVSAGPGECPFQRRHTVTKNLAGPNWFVMLSFDFSFFGCPWYERSRFTTFCEKEKKKKKNANTAEANENYICNVYLFIYFLCFKYTHYILFTFGVSYVFSTICVPSNWPRP